MLEKELEKKLKEMEKMNIQAIEGEVKKIKAMFQEEREALRKRIEEDEGKIVESKILEGKLDGVVFDSVESLVKNGYIEEKYLSDPKDLMGRLVVRAIYREEIKVFKEGEDFYVEDKGERVKVEVPQHYNCSKCKVVKGYTKANDCCRVCDSLVK